MLFLSRKNSLMPISDKQLAANRANAAKSTGPRTPEGKARSAQNSRIHGFTASSFTVVPGIARSWPDSPAMLRDGNPV